VCTVSADAPRLSANIIAIALVSILGLVAFPAPAAHADYCEVAGCWRECHAVPGGRWCRNVCHRRCWRAPDPEPEYEEPAPYAPEPTRRYQPPTHTPATLLGPDSLLFLFALGILVIIAALAGALSEDSATTAVVAATEETERDTAETKALIADAEAKAREIDAHLDRFLSDATRR
jgi:hypothetical protein